jgi:large subunit ribosomal protein L21
MYAICAIAGKQYRVAVNDLFDVDRLDVPVGETVEFNDVLLFARDDGEVRVGSPYLDDIAVVARIAEHGKDKKIIVFKSKRRKGYRRKRGHRQQYTRLRIEEIRPKSLEDPEPTPQETKATEQLEDTRAEMTTVEEAESTKEEAKVVEDVA